MSSNSQQHHSSIYSFISCLMRLLQLDSSSKWSCYDCHLTFTCSRLIELIQFNSVCYILIDTKHRNPKKNILCSIIWFLTRKSFFLRLFFYHQLILRAPSSAPPPGGKVASSSLFLLFPLLWSLHVVLYIYIYIYILLCSFLSEFADFIARWWCPHRRVVWSGYCDVAICTDVPDQSIMLRESRKYLQESWRKWEKVDSLRFF